MRCKLHTVCRDTCLHSWTFVGKKGFSFVVCLWSLSWWPYRFTMTWQALRRTNRASAGQNFSPQLLYGMNCRSKHPTFPPALFVPTLCFSASMNRVWESISRSKQVFPRQGLTVTLTPWMAVTPVCTHRLECEWMLMGGGHWEGTPQLN